MASQSRSLYQGVFPDPANVLQPTARPVDTMLRPQAATQTAAPIGVGNNSTRLAQALGSANEVFQTVYAQEVKRQQELGAAAASEALRKDREKFAEGVRSGQLFLGMNPYAVKGAQQQALRLLGENYKQELEYEYTTKGQSVPFPELLKSVKQRYSDVLGSQPFDPRDVAEYFNAVGASAEAAVATKYQADYSKNLADTTTRNITGIALTTRAQAAQDPAAYAESVTREVEKARLNGLLPEKIWDNVLKELAATGQATNDMTYVDALVALQDRFKLQPELAEEAKKQIGLTKMKIAQNQYYEARQAEYTQKSKQDTTAAQWEWDALQDGKTKGFNQDWQDRWILEGKKRGLTRPPSQMLQSLNSLYDRDTTTIVDPTVVPKRTQIEVGQAQGDIVPDPVLDELYRGDPKGRVDAAKRNAENIEKQRREIEKKTKLDDPAERVAGYFGGTFKDAAQEKKVNTQVETWIKGRPDLLTLKFDRRGVALRTDMKRVYNLLVEKYSESNRISEDAAGTVAHQNKMRADFQRELNVAWAALLNKYSAKQTPQAYRPKTGSAPAKPKQQTSWANSIPGVRKPDPQRKNQIPFVPDAWLGR